MRPQGANRAKTESMTQLTLQATTAGFIIAYADHPELSTTSTIQLGTIPRLIAKKWCIDEQRMFLTGHSDGGTASMALGFMSGSEDFPSAIAPSAAGLNYQKLSQHDCPEPHYRLWLCIVPMTDCFQGLAKNPWDGGQPVTIVTQSRRKLDNGCIEYPNCSNAVKTWYCEGDKPHSQWSGLNSAIWSFLSQKVAGV